MSEASRGRRAVKSPFAAIAELWRRYASEAGFVELTHYYRPDGAVDGFATLSPNVRPLGAPDFIAMVETKLGRKVRPGKRGRKPHGGRMD